MVLWMLVGLAVALYCCVQIYRDLRRRDYWMAALGGVCLAALLLTPVETHAVKVDLPMSPAR